MRGCSKPQPHGRKWRVVHPDEQGRRARSTFDSEREAQRFIDDFYAAASGAFGCTVAQAVDEYLASRRDAGLKAGTVTTLGYRLKGLLGTTERDRLVRTLTPAIARRMFESRRTKRGGRPSVDTQIGELVAVQGWAAWCIGRGYLKADPFAGIEVQGAKSRGKKQLRIDEARRLIDTALSEGSDAGLAAAMALLMDLRASEIIERQVRDVDDRGRVLWIDRAKTEAGDRHLEIPLALRDALAARCAGRKPEDLLFPGRSRHWVGYHVRRLCEAAGVPVVCPHGLRGTHSSISVREVSIEHVAAALGHSSPAVTRRHYVKKSAEQAGKQRAVLKVIDGGKRP